MNQWLLGKPNELCYNWKETSACASQKQEMEFIIVNLIHSLSPGNFQLQSSVLKNKAPSKTLKTDNLGKYCVVCESDSLKICW